MDGFIGDPSTIAVVDPLYLARMPLAEAALSVWRYVFDDNRLQEFWEQGRGRCYERVICFPTMVHLVADAILQHGGSGRRSFEKNIEQGTLQASVAAAFKKLGRLPLAVSQEFLESGATALQEVYPAYALRKLPASLRKFRPVTIDGKTVKNVAKRLKPLRGSVGGLLGGKSVVALEWTTNLAVGMQTHPDGDASEKRLVGALLARVCSVVAGPRLFVADRGFCDLVQMRHFTAAAGDHFLVRHHRGLTFTPDPARAEKRSTEENGRTVVETWGWAGSPSHKDRRYVRRLQLLRPGEEDLVLFTDLVDDDRYPAKELLWLYRQRWGIERMFQKVTEVFGLERLIGGTPQACIFQFAFCLVLYNIVQILTGYIAHLQKADLEDISKEKLFDDVQRELVAWSVFIQPAETIAYFQDRPTAKQLRDRLELILADAWSMTWWKAPPQMRRKPVERKKARSHASVYRILRDHLGEKRKKPPGSHSQRR
jgi:hypothetical protein